MKLRPFELGLLVVFGVLAVIALIVLSSYSPPPDEEDTLVVRNEIVIWGTLNAEHFDQVLREVQSDNEAFSRVSYRQIDTRYFDFELINAIAERRNPDLVLLSHERLVEHRNKLYPIPYESFTQRDFRSSYVDGAQIFALRDGIHAYPVMVDPLVMYWNRDLFASVGFISPPRTWEQIVGETAPSLVERDFNRSIIRSPIAFGSYENVNNAYDSLSLLLLQAGSEFIADTDRGYRVNINESVSENIANPLVDVLDFYTNFGSISNPLYSWNRTLPLDRQMFVAEDLALYFGSGSEARVIEELNPNLNFDIAEVPNSETATVRRTYGEFYGLAVLRESRSLADAFTVLSVLASSPVAQRLSQEYDMAPAHRSTLSAGSEDLYGSVVYDAAQVARGWLNPDRDRVDVIFTEAIGDLHANRVSVTGASGDINGRIGEVLR